MSQQNQHENPSDFSATYATNYPTQEQEQTSQKGYIPLKSRKILAGGLIFISLLFFAGLVLRPLLGIAFILTPFLCAILIVYTFYSLKKGGRMSDSQFLIWMGVMLFVLAGIVLSGMFLFLAGFLRGL